MDFPCLLQEAQERLGFNSQKELAAYLDIDPSQLSRYLRGMQPRLQSLMQVLTKLGYELSVRAPESEMEPRLDAGAAESHDHAYACDCRVVTVDFIKRIALK